MFQPTLDQLRQTLNAMPMPSRIIAGLLVVAIVLALGFLVRTTGSPSTEYLLGGRLMDESDLDAAEVAFGTAGLTGWRREGRRIEIPTEKRSDFLAALAESQSLPISLRTSVQAAHAQSTAWESSAMRDARQMHAKELDLGNKIAAFADVRWASVEYDRGERIGLSRNRPQTASVVVQPEGSQPLASSRIDMIQRMISGSFAGMSVDEVEVIDTNGTIASSAASDSDPLMRKRREAEAYFEQKIRSHLSGYGNIRVAAFAEIDPTMGTEKASITYADQPISISETSRKRQIESSRPVPGGVPGATPNALTSNRPAKLESSMQTSTTKDDTKTSEKIADQEFQTSRMAALAVQRVTVSIGIPTSYFYKVHRHNWLQENPDSAESDVPVLPKADLQKLIDETKLKIQGSVTPLLPAVAAGEDRFPLVEVTDYPDLPMPEVATAGTGSAVLTWLADSWQSIAMLGLAAVALMVARNAVTGTGGNQDPTDFREGFGLELPAPPVEAEEEDDSIESMEITGGSLKDELVTLVEANPEVAANVIRSWAGEAA
ncbi:MAG: flagellar M-ring protein FliF C-terminal domain-containing protein [Planctomycetota bacterium]